MKIDFKKIFAAVVAIVVVSLFIVLCVVWIGQRLYSTEPASSVATAPTVEPPIQGIDADKNLENAQPPVVAPYAALLNQPTKSNDHPLISPDGEWLLGVRRVGDVPFSRYVNYYLEFINLNGKANKYVYLDWFERAEDAPHGPTPLGWSEDGTRLYLIYAGTDSALERSLYARIWQYTGTIKRFDLKGDSYTTTIVDPYQGRYPSGLTGVILDADPRLELALWSEKQIKSGDKRLLLFPLSGDSSMTTKALALPDLVPATMITSATIDTKGGEVAFVVHQDGKDDRVFMSDVQGDSTRAVSYDLPLIRKLGIAGPFTLSVQKTSMAFEDGAGLFLTVTDQHGKSVVIRRNGDDRWSQE